MPRAEVKVGVPEKLTHKERRERRLQIAQAVHSGQDLSEVAVKFEVGTATVKSAVNEFRSLLAQKPAIKRAKK